MNSFTLSKPIPYFKLSGDVSHAFKEKIGTQEWKKSALKVAEVGMTALVAFAILLFTVSLDLISSPIIAILNHNFYHPPKEKLPQYQPTEDYFRELSSKDEPSAPPEESGTFSSGTSPFEPPKEMPIWDDRAQDYSFLAPEHQPTAPPLEYE